MNLQSGLIPPHLPPGPPGHRGFTLVEVLLAVTIGGVLVASVVSSTRAITNSRARIDVRAQRVAEARRGMEAIVGALRNIRRDPERPSSATTLISGRQGGPGEGDRIDFQVINDRPVRSGEPESDQQEVGFFLQRAGRSRLPSLMCRRDHALDEHPDDGGVVQVVARGIVGLTFEYFAAGEWHRDWASTEPQPPQAVRITLVAAVEPEPGERGVPEEVTLSSAVAIRVNPPPQQQGEQNRNAPSRGGTP